MERLPGELSTVVELGDRRVRVVTGGSGGPAVLFDAALGTPLEEWSLVAPQTARTRAVTLWDRPGVGRSDDGPTVTAEVLVELIAELLTRIGAPVVLVGHSLGGLHVLCVALEHPELVAGLVLVEPSHPDQNARLSSFKDPALQVAAAAARLPAAIRSGIGSLVAAAGAVLPLDRRTRAMTELAPLVAGRLRAVNEEHANADVLYGLAADLIGRASLRDLPVEVLTGGENFADDLSLRSKWHAMHGELAGLSTRGVHRIVQCGHDVPFAAPNAVVEAIERVAAATQ